MGKALIIKAVLLVIIFMGIIKMPHGYYNFLRLACTFGFTILMAEEWKNKHWFLSVTCSLCLFLFNFLAPIYFPKEVWEVVDIVVCTFLGMWILWDLLSKRSSPHT